MRESECKDFREVPKSAGSGKRHRRVRGASRRQLALVHAEGATGIQRGNARYCAGCGSMIDKLAALVPRPRFNLVQVSWCTCSAAEWGPYVVPSAALPDSLGHPAVSQKRRGQLISSRKWDVLPGNILHPALGIIRGLGFCTAFSRSMSWSAPSVPDALESWRQLILPRQSRKT